MTYYLILTKIAYHNILYIIYIFGKSEGENVIIHCHVNHVKLVAVLGSSVKNILKLKIQLINLILEDVIHSMFLNQDTYIGEFIEFFFIKSKNIINMGKVTLKYATSFSWTIM